MPNPVVTAVESAFSAPVPVPKSDVDSVSSADGALSQSARDNQLDELPNSNSLSAPNSNSSNISNVKNVSNVNDESINPIISSNVEIIANSNVKSSERNNVNSSESISEENVINEQNTDNESNNEMQSKHVNVYGSVIGSQSCGGDLVEGEISKGEESAARKWALSELSSDSEDSVSSGSFAKPLPPSPSRGAMKVPIVKCRLVGTDLFPLSLGQEPLCSRRAS